MTRDDQTHGPGTHTRSYFFSQNKTKKMRRIWVKERPLFRQKKTPKSDTLHRSKRLMSGFSGSKQQQLSSVCIATHSTLQEYDDTGSDTDVKRGHETFRLEVSYCTNRLCLWWSEIHPHLPNVPSARIAASAPIYRRKSARLVAINYRVAPKGPKNRVQLGGAIWSREWVLASESGLDRENPENESGAPASALENGH